MAANDIPRRAARWSLAARARTTLDALEHLAGGLGTAVLALVALLCVFVTAALCLVGVGIVLMPATLRVVRVVADRERARLSRWGIEIIGPEPVPTQFGAAMRDSAVRRELAWVLCHAILGLALSLAALTIPVRTVQELSFPLWWHLVSDGTVSTSPEWFAVQDLGDALTISLIGLVWLVAGAWLIPIMAWLQAWPGRRLLCPKHGTDLSLRVAQLTATRAGALDAHAAELRRIERSLHDGTQNRLVAVNVLVGAARRAVKRDPDRTEAILAQAQDAAEQALAELRAVVRSILPPVLSDRSLADALTALAASSPVPCRIDADLPDRCAASVEATAYFVVAESLTNIAQHSHARQADVTLHRRQDQLYLRITDDGRGGATEHGGSGLAGIRRRIEAHDGTFMLASPSGGPTTLTVSLPCGL